MNISCLTHLYTCKGLFTDGDGDGLPDGFDLRFSVGRTPGAIDVAARLGLECAAWTPGFTAATAAGTPVWFGPENPGCPVVKAPMGCGVVALINGGVAVTGGTLREGWEAALWLAQTYPFAFPDGPLLSELAGGQAVRAVYIRDGAVVDMELSTEEMPLAPSEEPVTYCGDTGAIPFPAEAPGDLPPPGLARLFTVAGLMGSSDSARHDKTGWQICSCRDLTCAEVAALAELAARTGVEATGLLFPFTVAGSPQGTAIHLRDQAPEGAEWVDGHLAWANGSLIAFGTPAERAAALLQAAATAGLVGEVHATLFTRRAGLSSEGLPEGELLLDVVLEQEWEVTRFWRLWEEQVLPTLGSGEVAIDLRISEPLAVREAMAEQLAAALLQKGITSAHIRVLSAYKQGFHWLEEEVLPRLLDLQPISRVTLACSLFLPGQGDALDLKIRWLQEVYPADEILAQAMGAEVCFELAEEAQQDTYVLTAYRPDGTVVYTEGFSPVCAVRSYMPDFLERGRVHPPTGLLRVVQAGEVLVEIGIDTDGEAFWSGYQAQVLPRLREFVTERFGAAPDPVEQPFFGALVVEVALSEDDRPLPIRQERISPLDAMHEDIYFYTLDYLHELGRSLVGEGYAAPGAIEPWVTSGEGGPRARIRLYGRPAVADAVADTLPAQAARLPLAAKNIPIDEVIGPEQLPGYLAYLANRPAIRVWQAGLSLGGRPTWALSVTAPTAGRIAPPQKLSAWRPTLLINARRHANEVSSTNSILRLAEMASENPVLLRRVNLFLSPLENVDGAALHYRMQEKHPHWLLHAARFNAAGVEFSPEGFAREPRYGEARTLPTLWRACLPDVLLDDHGYPSHEWVQPFSGYNSAPYFRTSWWMPNALIYTIFRWLDGAQFPANHAVQEGLRDALAERFSADEGIAAYSRALLDRYITYGRRYLPHLFPLEMHRESICLRWPAAVGAEARTYAGRFPHITAAEVVTEVPDETAQGDYLALCAKAHLVGDLAVLDFLAERSQPVVRRRASIGERVHWRIGRERPFRP